QREGARRAFEQANAKRLLKVANAQAHGRARHACPTGRSGEAAGAHQINEGLKRIEVHRLPFPSRASQVGLGGTRMETAALPLWMNMKLSFSISRQEAEFGSPKFLVDLCGDHRPLSVIPMRRITRSHYNEQGRR